MYCCMLIPALCPMESLSVFLSVCLPLCNLNLFPSLALHPKGLLVATGQVGRDPSIRVWDSETLETASVLHGAHARGVASLSFGAQGRLLASVGLEDAHRLVVWDWCKGLRLAAVDGHPSRIFDAQFHTYAQQSVVTCGVKHVTFWSLHGNVLSGKPGDFGKTEPVTQLCLAFGPDGTTYTGGLNGDVCVWKGHRLANVIPQAHGVSSTEKQRGMWIC